MGKCTTHLTLLGLIFIRILPKKDPPLQWILNNLSSYPFYYNPFNKLRESRKFIVMKILSDFWCFRSDKF